MTHVFDKNREKLMNLIYKTKKFEENEIIEKFAEENQKDIIISSSMTIKEFLSLLCERGVLINNGIEYQMIPASNRLLVQMYSL